MSITTVHDDTPAWLRYNFGGKSIDYDYGPVVRAAETDTTFRLDLVNRGFVYNAERHTDSFSATELGSVLHLADIGDVNISRVQDNSLLVYQKDTDCGEGCDGGPSNQWVGWNSDDNLVDVLDAIMGFDTNGKPQALRRPENTNQYYTLGWNGSDKAGWTQPVEAAIPPVDGDNYRYNVYLDPYTRRFVFVREEAE